MNEHTHICTQLIFSYPPPPTLLVDMQLDKRVFNKALGTHTLPFQSCFHNCKAQLHQLTLTELYQMEPLVPLQHTESHPTQNQLSFPPALNQCLTLMDAALLLLLRPTLPLNMICSHSDKSHSVMEQLSITLKVYSSLFLQFGDSD